MKQESKVSQIKDFWNDNPVGNNFVTYQQDKSFYKKCDTFRYSTKGQNPAELDKIDFRTNMHLYGLTKLPENYFPGLHLLPPTCIS